jgi:hypothetical protein
MSRSRSKTSVDAISFLKEDHARVHKAFKEFEKMEKIDDQDLMNEAQVEHNSAKDLIRRLEGMKADDPYYAATFTVLCEYVDHHAKEEETEMFPEARKLKLDLEALGERMMARKEELMAAA